jgi:Protein of unknown function (DUF1236)
MERSAENTAREAVFVEGTMPRAMHWLWTCAPAQAGPHRAKGVGLMRNRILAVATIATAIAVPVAVQAQGYTTGVARGPAVVVDEDAGIAVERRPAFREYVIRERIPNHTIPDRVVVGTILPESGVTFYEVPQDFGAVPYRYTVVNGETVLVEPQTRRIVQVLE